MLLVWVLECIWCSWHSTFFISWHHNDSAAWDKVNDLSETKLSGWKQVRCPCLYACAYKVNGWKHLIAPSLHYAETKMMVGSRCYTYVCWKSVPWLYARTENNFVVGLSSCPVNGCAHWDKGVGIHSSPQGLTLSILRIEAYVGRLKQGTKVLKWWGGGGSRLGWGLDISTPPFEWNYLIYIARGLTTRDYPYPPQRRASSDALDPLVWTEHMLGGWSGPHWSTEKRRVPFDPLLQRLVDKYINYVFMSMSTNSFIFR